MNISPIQYNNIQSFKALSSLTDKNKNQITENKTDQNPISKMGEKSILVTTTFLGGLGLGFKLLFELFDGDFIIDKITNTATDIVNKQHKNASSIKKAILLFGAIAGISIGTLSAFALLYTLLNAHKINYKGNVNAFQKRKEMDVFIKGNDAEKALYSKINERAKIANDEGKKELQAQYLQMKFAKNKVPDFISLS